MNARNSLLNANVLADSSPMVGGFRLKANQVAYWCWCLMLFFIPFSTALGLLMSALAIVSGLLGFSLQSFKKTFKQPVIILCVLLFGWLTLSMLWSIAPKAEMLEAWSKYRKLLYPALVMMVLYNLGKGVRSLVYAFMAGCGVVATASLLSVTGLLELILGPPQVEGGWYLGPGWLYVGGPENPTFGRNHITQSAFLAFAAMLALGQTWFLGQCQRRLRASLSSAFSAILLLAPIFLLQSRTGYVLSAILFVYWAFVVQRYLPKKLGLILVLSGGLLLTITAAKSPHLPERIRVMTDSVLSYADGEAMTDSAVRLVFWKSGLNILSKSPMMGVGLGGYAEAFANLENRPEWLAKNRSQPHSEYVLIATQGGLIGLSMFLALLLLCLKSGAHKINEHPEAVGLLLLYSLDAAINSVIWDLAEGHLFVLVTLIVLQAGMSIGISKNQDELN